MKTKYEINKDWRHSHPEKWREGVRRYYRKSQDAPNRKERWSKEDIKLVMEHKMPDSELSKLIGRSVQAIQVQRSRNNGTRNRGKKSDGAL